MKKTLRYLLLVAIAMGSFLFSPCPDIRLTENSAPLCVPLSDHARVVINTDSYAFIGSAIDPHYILQPKSPRQSRPLFVLYGTAVGYAIYYASTPFHGSIERFLATKTAFRASYSASQRDNGTRYFCFYAGFLLINVLTLLICLFLFEKVITLLCGTWKNSRFLFSLILLILIANPVTKMFVWGVHQQLFNVLTPLLCLYLGIDILRGNLRFRKLVAASFGLGLLLLVYGNFLLTLPVLLACYLFKERKRTQALRVSPFLKAGLLAILFFLPTLGWIAVLRGYGTDFYSAEIEIYRQFVWILDRLRESPGSFFSALLQNTYHFLQTTGTLLTSFALVLLAFCLQGGTKASARFLKELHSRLPGAGALLLFVFVETLVFFWLLGYYADRLTMSLAPLLLCCFAIVLNRQRLNKFMNGFLILLLLGLYFHAVFFEPVYFSRALYEN